MEATAHKIDAKERTSDVKLSEKVPFNKMVLSSGVRNGLHRAGYVYPTVLQANAIPIGKAGIDLIVQSKSGTGKTLIFTVVLLEVLHETTAQHPQALILAPTREIAVQIENTVNVLGSCCPGFKAVSVIGGLDITADRKNLQRAITVVGTPGRVLHLIQNDIFNTSDLKLLIIDEADKMMSSTFKADFEKIFNRLPANKQTIACSATFCNELDSLLAKYMRNPFLISTEKRTTSLLGIKQLIYELPEEKTNILEMQGKVAALCQIFSNVSFKQCMVFSNSQSRAESYRSFLCKEGWPCEVISGAQNQKTRIEVFHKFREFKTRILVATDLMARGIDSENVNLVINLELPDDGATYLHRIGRAGRFGSHGIAISFIASKKDREKLKKLLEKIGFAMEILRFPKSRIVDLWNFNDPEGEKSLLGLFNINENVECEKENVNNNCQDDATNLCDEPARSKRQSVQNDGKRDVLRHLIDSKSSVRSQTNRNGNLFSDFMEEVNSNSLEIKTETVAVEEEQIVLDENEDTKDRNADVSNEKPSEEMGLKSALLSIVCDTTEGEAEIKVDLFEDFAKNSTIKGEVDGIVTIVVAEKEDENLKSEVENESIDEDIKLNSNTVSNGDYKTIQAALSVDQEKLPEELITPLVNLLVDSKPNPTAEDIFEKFNDAQVEAVNGEATKPSSKEVGFKKLNQKSKHSGPKKSLKSETKNSSRSIKEAIREVHDNIVSSSESPWASLKSFSEPQPSTSMQPIGPSSDNSAASNYPCSSCPTSANQTNQDMFNISSLTDDVNVSFNASDLNTSNKQEIECTTSKTRTQSSSSSSVTPELKSYAGSTTETASERGESSGFGEDTSDASSGVVTSATSSSSSTSIISDTASTTTDSEDSSQGNTYNVNTSSESESTEVLRKRKPHKLKSDNKSDQKAFHNWTKLYWNQVAQIQNYVQFYQYAKQHSSQLS